MEYCLLSGAWIAFCLLHSLLADRKCKAYFQSKMGVSFKYYRLWYSLFALITLCLVLWWQFSIPHFDFTVSPILKHFVGVPAVIVALALMAACICKYFYKLSGVEAIYGRPDPPFLETRGVHSVVRHPLYLGTLLLIWSLLLFFPTVANLLACVIITGYVRIGISSEERSLVRTFGRQYDAYKKRTPMLVPKLTMYRRGIARTDYYRIR